MEGGMSMTDNNVEKKSQRRGNRSRRKQSTAARNNIQDDALPRCQHNKLCVNSSCPRCFPGLGTSSVTDAASNNAANDDAWSLSPSSFPPLFLSEASGVQRIISSDLVELPLILCASDGTEKQAIKVIRCCLDDTLLDVRNMLTKGSDPSNQLPENFSFLKEVGGRILKLSRDQETGGKAYKAKHFASSKQKHQLRICVDDDDGDVACLKQPGSHGNFGVVEFCVRHIMSDDNQRGGGASSSVLGMCRLHKDLPIWEIRQQIVEQLPEAPVKTGRFVRMLGEDITLITLQQESKSCKNPLYAHHFLPPYTPKPELILMTSKSYTEGEGIPDETKNRELKSLAFPLLYQGSNPRDVVKEKVATYINAFLNSSGGVLIFGANDDGIIERVPIAGKKDSTELSLDERVKLARYAKDDIRKLIDAKARGMDPTVDNDLVTTRFVPVRRDSNDSHILDEQTRHAEHEIHCVIEVHCKAGRQQFYFLDKHSFDAYERRDGSTFLMDKTTIMQSLNSSAPTRPGNLSESFGVQWRGGWRQLHSAFDFDALMRRQSDPWAGREWLFASVRRLLFEMIESEKKGPFAPRLCGLAIRGSRGMGKTAFLSELALRPKRVSGLKVVAHHVCRSDDPDTLNPALFVHSVAAMLARNCKEYRSLMVQSSNDSNSDLIGDTMLRALHPEHCESDPDDAFSRGILEPLRHIDASRQSEEVQQSISLPLIIIVDALDECLTVTTERRPGRSGSTTVAHLLERTMSNGRSLPSWVKFIVSFRSELVDIPGTIKRLSKRVKLIDLDFDNDVNDKIKKQRDKIDIQLFIQAYIERTRMISPNGERGSGNWDFVKAAKLSDMLEIQNGRNIYCWHYFDSGKWKPFDDMQNTDLLFAQNIGAKYCTFLRGKGTFRADLQGMKLTSLKSCKEQSIRMVKLDSISEREQTTHSSGAIRGNQSKSESENCSDESTILNALASNSQGNYLHARTVLEEIRSGRLNWDQALSIPQGLELLYDHFFRGFISSEASTTRPSVRVVQPVLEVLLAAPKSGLTEREIIHSVVISGTCDPAAVIFCLRDIAWAVDIDSSYNRLLYHLRHESIRSFLRDGGDMKRPLQCNQANGHMMLAASLLQRCWPQQTALSRWMQKGNHKEISALNDWYNWSDWVPNKEDGDVYNLALHLSQCDVGSEEERILLLKTIGQDLLDSAFHGKGTALHAAAFVGNVPAIKLLLGANASPDVVVRGRSPLHYAAGKGFSTTVSLLLSAGANVASATQNNRTPLLCAASRGSPTTVKCILEAISGIANDSTPDSDGARRAIALLNSSLIDSGRTSLSLAAEEGHDEVIQLLLEAGASATLADRGGRTPIYYAARFGRVQPKSIKALIKSPNGTDALGWGETIHLRSPLHVAVWYGHLHVVQALLECGADPSLVESKNGWSALHEACCLGNYGYQHRNRRLHDALSKNGASDQVDEETKRLDILRLLLNNKLCVKDLGDIYGCTALWYAAGGGWTHSVKELLDYGACVEPGDLASLPNKARRGPASPLLLALKRQHYKIATLLIEKGACLPPTCELESLCAMPGISLELVQEIKEVQPDHISSPIDFSMAIRCKAVPNEEYAR